MGWYVESMECPHCESKEADKWIRPDDSFREGYYYLTCRNCGLVAFVESVTNPYEFVASFINKDIIGKKDKSWGDFDMVEEKNEDIVLGVAEKL